MTAGCVASCAGTPPRTHSSQSWLKRAQATRRQYLLTMPPPRDPWVLGEDDSEEEQREQDESAPVIGHRDRSRSRSREPVSDDAAPVVGQASLAAATAAPHSACPVGGLPGDDRSAVCGLILQRQMKLKTPSFPDGSEWWARVVWDAFAGERAQRPSYVPATEVLYESFCSGTMMENFGATAMDLQLKPVSCADFKKHARDFCKRHHKVEHIFTDFCAQIYEDNSRVCDVCDPSRKTGVCSFRLVRPHIAVGGLPCQPFTRLRTQNLGRGDQGEPASHSKYATVFKRFSDYLAFRQPYVVVVEEVCDFARAERGQPSSCPTPLEKLMGIFAEQGYYSQALALDSAVWLNVSRPRLYLIAMTEDCGGAVGLEWVEKNIQHAFSYRKINAPLDVWDILGSDLNHTSRRADRDQGQAPRAETQFAKWKAESATMRDKYNMSKDSRPWTSTARLTGLPDKARFRDVVDVAWGARLAGSSGTSTREELSRNYWCDVTQAVARAPWSTGLRCITQNSLSYSFEKDVVLSGYDEMRLHGAPVDSCPQEGRVAFSNAQLRSLAGESFSCPVVTCVLYAAWLNPHAIWWKA